MKQPSFWLALVTVLFVWLVPQALSSSFGLPLREAQASMLASLGIGFGLAFKLTPEINTWGGFRYLKGWYAMFLLLGTVWLLRTVVVLQVPGLWPLLAIVVTGLLFGFVVGSLEFRRAVRESA